MLWTTLFNRLSRIPQTITNHQHVNAILRNPQTQEYETIFLCLKFDTQGNPYLIQDGEPHENPRKPLKTHRKQA